MAASYLGSGHVDLEQPKMFHSWKFVTIWSEWWLPWKSLLTGLVLILAWSNLFTKERPSPGLCSDSAGANTRMANTRKGKYEEKNVHMELDRFQHVLEDLASCAHGQGCVRPERSWKVLCLTSGWHSGSVPNGNEGWAIGVASTKASWQKVKTFYGGI